MSDRRCYSDGFRREDVREADTQPPPPMHDWLEPLVDGAVAATVEKLFEGRTPELVSHKSRELLQAIIRDAVLSVLEQLVADGPPSEAEVLRLQLDEALRCLEVVRRERDQVRRERDQERARAEELDLQIRCRRGRL